MQLKDSAIYAVNALKSEYPDAKCSLVSENPLQLLIATRLSAQCTDARVNLVTPALFERFPTLDSFCKSNEDEIAVYIRSCGLYKTKARDIFLMCLKLRDDFDGEVPDSLEKLLTLPGVGRKTANLIMGDVYKKPAIVADTHCIRITNRLGFCSSKDPYKVEMQLMKILPPEESNDFCHRLVLHGRAVCDARKPMCEKCALSPICKYYSDLTSGNGEK